MIAYSVRGPGYPAPEATPPGLAEQIGQSLAQAPWWAWPAAAFTVFLAVVGLLVWSVRGTRRVLDQRRERLRLRARDDETERGLRRVKSQVTMDRLIAVQFLIAMGFSAYGMSQTAHETAGIPVPANWLLFVVFEGFALTLMVMINQRAGEGLPYPGLLSGYWVVIAVAAVFNATHGSGLVGSLVWAAITLMAGCSYALRMSAKRADQEKRLKQAAGRWASRRVALVRWLHPVERMQVALELASDEDLGADEATARVRQRSQQRAQRRALRRVVRCEWRLRRAQSAARLPGLGWWADARERAWETRAQAAIGAAQLATSTATVARVLRELQMMDMAGRIARMDYSSAVDARQAMANLITEERLTARAEITSGSGSGGGVPVTRSEPVRRTEPVTGGEPVVRTGGGSGSGGATVTPMRAQVTDEDLIERAREVWRPGISIAEFRRLLGVGMRKAHPLHRLMSEEQQQETG